MTCNGSFFQDSAFFFRHLSSFRQSSELQRDLRYRARHKSGLKLVTFFFYTYLPSTVWILYMVFTVSPRVAMYKNLEVSFTFAAVYDTLFLVVNHEALVKYSKPLPAHSSLLWGRTIDCINVRPTA